MSQVESMRGAKTLTLIRRGTENVAAVYDRRFFDLDTARTTSCSREMASREPGQQVVRATQGAETSPDVDVEEKLKEEYHA